MENNKTKTLEALLKSHEISDFSRTWIEKSNTNEENIKGIYKILKRIGLTDDKIASRAELLGMAPETIEKNYKRLSALGLKDDKIASRAELLGRDPETIERNYKALSKLGLKDEKIASRAELLGMAPETIERNYKALSKLGLKDEKIASRADLLGRDPETIGRNYKAHIGLLRQYYEDRNSGKNLLTSQAQLLGIPPETINANVQYLTSMKIDYNNAFLLGTTVQLKRKKMAWILRELFNYRQIPEDKKQETIQRMYEFVKENPRYLVKSISALEKAKDKIEEKISLII